MTNHGEQRGFALVIAVLVTGVLVAVTYVMFSIGLKQLSLATAGKQSQIAFYAAEAGLECALYLDYVPTDTIFENHTETSTLTRYDITFVPRSSNLQTTDLACYGIAETIGATPLQALGGDNTVTTTFRVRFPSGNDQCADVVVKKSVNEVAGNGDPNSLESTDMMVTTVESRGYNICPDGTTNPLRAERGVRLTNPPQN